MFQLCVLARRETRDLDLFRDVLKIVRALLSLGTTRRQASDFASQRGKFPIRAPNGGRLTLGSAKRVEDAPLRFAIEQCLRVVLAVQVHELTPYLGEHGGRNRGAVDPGPSASIPSALTLDHIPVVPD